MQAPIQLGALLCEEDWNTLAEAAGAEEPGLLKRLLADFQDAGAQGFFLKKPTSIATSRQHMLHFIRPFFTPTSVSDPKLS